MSYTSIFGGNTIKPADVSYSLLTTAVDVAMSWPGHGDTPSTSAIVEVNATAANVDISMPDATLVSVGEGITVRNVGSNTFNVNDHAGGSIVTVASGNAYTIYISDNTTAAGTWGSWQAGAGTSVVDAATLDGNGLEAHSGLLRLTILVEELTTNTVLTADDRAHLKIWTPNTAAGTITMPAAAGVGEGWFVRIKNKSSVAITLLPASSETFEGAADISLSQGQSVIVVSDGANYVYVKSIDDTVANNFSYAGISISGSGDYTLSETEYSNRAIKLFGTLTGNRNIIVPYIQRDYWFNNQAGGAYTVTIKTATGTGVVIPSGLASIVYCNGFGVIDADTTETLTLPLAVNQGGTGSTTADAALTALGGTTPGKSVFTSTSYAAMRATVAVLKDTQALGQVDTIAALRLLDGTFAATTVNVNSYLIKTAYTDGVARGGGLFALAVSNTDADDGVLTIVDAATRRWKLIHAGTVSIAQCGARVDGDSSGDDIAAVNLGISLLNTGSTGVDTLEFDAGNCYIKSEPNTLTSGQKAFRGHGHSISKLSFPSSCAATVGQFLQIGTADHNVSRFEISGIGFFNENIVDGSDAAVWFCKTGQGIVQDCYFSGCATRFRFGGYLEDQNVGNIHVSNVIGQPELTNNYPIDDFPSATGVQWDNVSTFYGAGANAIMRITNANPAVVYCRGTRKFSNGATVRPGAITGSTEINNNDYVVANTSDAYVTLRYNGGTVIFAIGQTVTGGTSGAHGTVVAVDDNDGTGARGFLMVGSVTGTFVDNETLFGSGGSPGAAIANIADATDYASNALPAFTFELQGINSTAYVAYVSGGTVSLRLAGARILKMKSSALGAGNDGHKFSNCIWNVQSVIDYGFEFDASDLGISNTSFSNCNMDAGGLATIRFNVDNTASADTHRIRNMSFTGGRITAIGSSTTSGLVKVDLGSQNFIKQIKFTGVDLLCGYGPVYEGVRTGSAASLSSIGDISVSFVGNSITNMYANEDGVYTGIASAKPLFKTDHDNLVVVGNTLSNKTEAVDAISGAPFSNYIVEVTNDRVSKLVVADNDCGILLGPYPVKLPSTHSAFAVLSGPSVSNNAGKPNGPRRVLSTTNATVTILARDTLADGYTYIMSGTITGVKTDLSDRSETQFRIVAHAAAGAVTVDNTVLNINEYQSDATWGHPTVTTSTSEIRINVTGKAATAITWALHDFKCEVL